MGVYKASDAKSYEYQGADTFRMEKPGDRAQVVFLYTDKDSIDGYGCHRLENASHYTFTVDCSRGPKDPLSACPGCADGAKLWTRIFVRVLDVHSGKVLLWDKPSSFRQTLEGFMHYFPCLYKQKYEITREGTGLNTRYTFQSIGDSGLTEEQYNEYCKGFDESIASYVRPADKYDEIKARVAASMAEAVNEAAPQGNAWGGAPTGNAWGAQPTASQNNGWGQAPSQPSAPAQSNWGQAPAPAPTGNWGQAPQSAPQQTPPPQQGGWGQAPAAGGWGQAPNQ